ILGVDGRQGQVEVINRARILVEQEPAQETGGRVPGFSGKTALQRPGPHIILGMDAESDIQVGRRNRSQDCKRPIRARALPLANQMHGWVRVELLQENGDLVQVELPKLAYLTQFLSRQERGKLPLGVSLGWNGDLEALK